MITKAEAKQKVLEHLAKRLVDRHYERTLLEDLSSHEDCGGRAGRCRWQIATLSY